MNKKGINFEKKKTCKQIGLMDFWFIKSQGPRGERPCEERRYFITIYNVDTHEKCTKKINMY